MIAKLLLAVSIVLAPYAPAPARVEAPAPAGEPTAVQAAPTIEPPEMLWPIMQPGDETPRPGPGETCIRVDFAPMPNGGTFGYCAEFGPMPTSTPPPNAYP